ncbi:class III signal peptide-containing protein [Methanocaldococcus sp. 16A]
MLFNKRAQLSLEFSILLLVSLLVIIIAVGWPGMFGLKKTATVSSMSLAHAAVSKMKQNIELVAAADEGTTKIVYIKCPPGEWNVVNNQLQFKNPSFSYTITTNCSVDVTLTGDTDISTSRIITVNITKTNVDEVTVNIQ